MALAFFAMASSAHRRLSVAWQIVAITSLAAMGLTKETFVPLIPVMLFFWVGARQYFQRDSVRETLASLRKPLSASMAVFVIEMALIAWVYQRRGYGFTVVHKVAEPFSLQAWGEILWAVSDRFAYYVPIAMAVILGIYNMIRTRTINVYILGAVLLTLGVCLPQFLLLDLYGTTIRYFYPAAVGLAGLSAIALDQLRPRRLLQATCALVCVTVAIPVGFNTYSAAKSFAFRTKALNEMLDHVARSSRPEKAIVLYADPIDRFEQTISLVFHLGARGVKAPVYLYPAGEYDEDPMAYAMMSWQFPDRVDTSALSERFLEMFFRDYNQRIGKRLSLSEIGTIILLRKEKEFAEKPPPWFEPSSARKRDFPTEGCGSIAILGDCIPVIIEIGPRDKRTEGNAPASKGEAGTEEAENS